MSTEVLFSRLKYFFQLANANFRIKIKQFGQSTSICEFKEEFKKYYKDSFNKDLYKIINCLYYNNLPTAESKEIYFGISDVFNKGDILETSGKELTEEYRKDLKNKITKN